MEVLHSRMLKRSCTIKGVMRMDGLNFNPNVSGSMTNWWEVQSSTNQNSMFNQSNVLGISLTDYASLTNGSYKKLLTAYYAKVGDDKPKSTEDAKSKAQVKTSAAELRKATGVLTKTGKDSIFNKVAKTDKETGETTYEYDTDKIMGAVKDFVNAYNSMVGSSTDSTNNTVLRRTLNMVNGTLKNSGLLGSVGVSVGEDNKLKLDEEKFKNANMLNVKSLFEGRGSFGESVYNTATQVYNVSNSNDGKGLYTASALFGSYNAGGIFDGFF